LDHLLEELNKMEVMMLTEVKKHMDMHQDELSDKVVCDYKNSWRGWSFQRQLLVWSVCLMQQIGKGTIPSVSRINTASKVECSWPKSCLVPSERYIAVASARQSNSGKALKPHLPHTRPRSASSLQVDGGESTEWPS
jgi:hypothetical protein